MLRLFQVLPRIPVDLEWEITQGARGIDEVPPNLGELASSAWALEGKGVLREDLYLFKAECVLSTLDARGIIERYPAPSLGLVPFDLRRLLVLWRENSLFAFSSGPVVALAASIGGLLAPRCAYLSSRGSRSVLGICSGDQPFMPGTLFGASFRVPHYRRPRKQQERRVPPRI
jgi:hypothetical protein